MWFHHPLQFYGGYRLGSRHPSGSRRFLEPDNSRANSTGQMTC
jgi:hypothetical protein